MFSSLSKKAICTAFLINEQVEQEAFSSWCALRQTQSEFSIPAIQTVTVKTCLDGHYKIRLQILSKVCSPLIKRDPGPASLVKRAILWGCSVIAERDYTSRGFYENVSILPKMDENN